MEKPSSRRMTVMTGAGGGVRVGEQFSTHSADDKSKNDVNVRGGKASPSALRSRACVQWLSPQRLAWRCRVTFTKFRQSKS